MMRKLLAVCLVLLMIAALAGCGSPESSAPSASTGAQPSAASSQGGEAPTQAATNEEPIKIGFFGPLTGNSSLIGGEMLNATQLAIEEINAAGGILGRRVELVYYDDKSSPDESIQAVTKMIDSDKVAAIIGSVHSGNIQVAGDIIEEAKVPMIGAGASPSWLDQGWTYLFRSCMNTYVASFACIDACKSLGVSKMGVFYISDEYGTASKTDMITLCNENGITVTGEESATYNDTDLTSQITNLMSGNPEIIYCVGTTNYVGPMVKQLRTNGYEGYIVGETAVGSPIVVEAAEAGADLLVFGAPFLIPATAEEVPDYSYPNDKVANYYKNYLAKYGETSIAEAAPRSYDGMYLFKEAMEAAGSTDGTAVRDALYAITDYEGLHGTYNYAKTHDGEGIDSVLLYIYVGGYPGGKYLTVKEFMETDQYKALQGN